MIPVIVDEIMTQLNTILTNLNSLTKTQIAQKYLASMPSSVPKSKKFTHRPRTVHILDQKVHIQTKKSAFPFGLKYVTVLVMELTTACTPKYVPVFFWSAKLSSPYVFVKLFKLIII